MYVVWERFVRVNSQDTSFSFISHFMVTTCELLFTSALKTYKIFKNLIIKIKNGFYL